MDGKIVQHATFKTVFFNAEGDKVDHVTADSVASHGAAHSISSCLPNWCKVSILAQWTSISLGTYGASLKPKASQIRVFPNERLNNDECMLGGDNEEDDGDFCLPDGLALGSIAPQRVEQPKPVAVKPAAAPAPVKKPAPLVEAEPEEEVEEDEVDVEEDEEVEVEEVVEEAPKPAPVPVKPAPATARRATRVVAAKA